VRAYLQDPAREVMVIIDAAIALAALSHVVAIEPRIGHRGRARGTAIAASGTTSSTGLVLLRSPPEERSTAESSESHHSYNDSGRDCGSILALRGLCLHIFVGGLRTSLRCHGLCRFTGSTGSSGGRPVGFRRGFAVGTALGCGGLGVGVCRNIIF
jgi:hypothetical protein